MLGDAAASTAEASGEGAGSGVEAALCSRDLIEAWAVAFIREFKSGDQLLDPRRPIRVGWALPPTTFKNPPWVGWPKEGEITEDARDAPVDESLPCGFMGNRARARASNL